MTSINISLGDKLFSKLHQSQIDLINNPTNKKIISNYHALLIDLFENDKSVNDETKIVSKNLLEFLIFPLFTSINKINKPDQNESEENQKINQNWCDLNELLIKSINLILRNFRLTNISLFFDTIAIVSLLLSKNVPFSSSIARKVSEEFYIECFKLISVLFQNSCPNQILDNFYRFKYLTSIGLIFSLSLDIIVNLKSISVRLEALNALKCLSCYDNDNLFDFHKRVGILFSSFLPGISIKLIQKFLLTENLKIMNHKLLTSSLDLMVHIISNIFNDKFLNEAYYKNYFYQSLKEFDEIKNSKEIKGLIVDRYQNKDWLPNSNSQLFVLIHRLFDQLILIDNYYIQISLVRFSSVLTNECYFSLNSNLSFLFKILVIFSTNEDHFGEKNENLKVNAIKSLKKFESIDQEVNKDKISSNFVEQNKFSILSTCFEEILLKLPRMMENQSQFGQKNYINELKALYGYLKLITLNNLNNFFQTNLNNLNLLLEGLISCISFDYKSLENFYSIECKNLDVKNNSNYNGLKTYLDDKLGLFYQLSNICEFLGKSDASRLLIDEILNKKKIAFGHNYCELMFLINLIIIGVSKSLKLNENTISIINLVLNNFISEYKMRLCHRLDTIQNVSMKASIDMNINNRNRKIIETCMIIEAINISSKCFKLEEKCLNKLLIETLFFVLENYLNLNLLIRVVSIKCLNDMAINLKFNNIQTLLSVNYDYIMNDLILKSNIQYFESQTSNHINQQPSHVFILCSLLDISNSDLTNYLERLLDEYFVSIELYNNDYNLLISICQIMKHMSRAMLRWYPLQINFLKNKDQVLVRLEDDLIELDYKEYVDYKQKPDSRNSFLDTLKFVDKRFIKFKHINENFTDDENQDSEDFCKKSLNEERNNKIPSHVKLQTICLTLCIHLVSHPSKEVRLYLIDSIRYLCKNLSQHVNEFLPLVHRLWSPLCYRFSSDDLLVKNKLVHLFFDLSLLCGDFLGLRFVKEFLPSLCSFMKHQSTISINSIQNDPTYIYSNAFKLQSSILTNIDKICILLDVKELELENVIVECILTHLDQRQPKKLQQLAYESIQNFSLIGSNIVWLTLHHVIPFNDFDYNKVTDYSPLVKVKNSIQLNDDMIKNLVQVFNNI